MKKIFYGLLCAGIMSMTSMSAYYKQESKHMTEYQTTDVVVLETNLGDITVELYGKEAPKSVENFLSYVEDKHYDGTIFHRVIDGFMVQGGGFDTNFDQKECKAPIVNEATNGLANERGTVAMARTMDVDSATAQFFINLSDNDFLNHKNTSSSAFGYCVFAKVTDGMDVVDKMAKARTGNKGPHQDVPREDIVINRVKVTESKKS
jgi:peptidyl-prolyl cis-trans isomerase B (cyclophilin B)